ncbi:uncharacterized protein LOC135497733 [Lineus longissimus]|uniref:uncharacterized protein LOC135497733 n=1 Tax=Lineus longissimus TaxID=88925 RepID=UPI00315CB212
MGAAELDCSWSGFKDEESGIKSYEFGLGSTPGREDVSALEVLAAHTTRHKVLVTATTRKYFAVLRATNFLGLTCEVTSSAITIDDTAPIPGVIVETSDIFNVNYRYAERSQGDIRNMRSCKTNEECQQIDATCQDSTDQVGVAWTHFNDPETGIKSYHLAVGTSPGGSQIKSFFPVPVTSSRFRITGLNLKGKEKIYVTIKAFNAAGLSSSATSNGIYLSYVAQGLEPPNPISVFDGDNKMEDMDYQHEKVSMGRISARWNFNGDPCPSSRYEWRIERVDGRVIQDYINSNGQSFGSYDGVKTEDGEMYYVKVKSTNALGQVYIKRSDGLTIRRNQLHPGRVNDGDIVGFDLNYSPTTNQVKANWQSFGKHDPIAVLSGNSGVKEEKPLNHNHQVVSYYEVAVGTDRRYSHTRHNIVPYTNVGRNLSVTFNHLNLHAKQGIYYTTVRAHSTSMAMVEVTSNGFTAGYNNGVKAGEITMSEFWSNFTHVFARWEGFGSDAGIIFYHAGVTNTTIPENYTCDNAALKENLFPIASIRNVGDNTMVELSGLNLSYHSNYFLYVIGTDDAGLCNFTYHQFRVDTTPPDEGEIKVGPYWHLGAAFTATKNLIQVEWQGYGDAQSGIARFEISLWSAPSCDRNYSSKLVPYDDWIKLSTNFSSYSLIQLDLKEMIPYFVKLRVYNKAGLFVETVSKPIFVDESTPTAGDVIDGHTFTDDLVWQKSTSDVNGTFLHFAIKNGTPCPARQVDFTSGWTKIDGIGLGVQRGVRWGIKYSADAIRNEANTLISIHMTRVRAGYSYLRSGAIARDADMSNVTGGDYIVRIRAADGQGIATTSVLLWDGPDDMLQDHDWQDEPEWTGEHSTCKCCFTIPPPKKCPCDCKSYRKSSVNPQRESHGPNAQQQQKIKHANKTASDVVVLKIAPTEFTTQRSCGFQLIAGTKPHAVLWCSTYNDTLEKLKEKRYLDYDPSGDWHTYKIRIYAMDNEPVHPQWCIDVFETKRQLLLGRLCGIEGFTPKTKLIFHLWNKDNFLPKSPVWKATAWFDRVRLPASDTSLCRYGSVFRGGSSAIIAYEAGVGTKPMATDVAQYKMVAQPCIPCIHACDVFTCDKSCPGNRVMQMRFTLDELSLPVTIVTTKQNNRMENETTSQIKQTNGTNSTESESVVYFLTVKAVLGSGAHVTRSSNGFRIDTTAPVLDKDINVTYIDFEQGEYKPVSYQSSNGTIKALWRCVDQESMIMDHQWAIGTEPGRMNIQNFTSVGRNPAGTRTGLEGVLHHNHTYYVSIICTNYAGSRLKYEDKKGVKVLLEKPIVKDVRTTLPGTKPFDRPVRPINARVAKSKESIGITWTKARDQNIRRYEFGIGTSACEEGEHWNDDVFPFTWVGMNEAGKIEIKDGSVYYNDTKLNDTCTFSRTNYEENRNKTECLFNMEIGRTVFLCMKLCNLADKCVLKESGSVTFVEEGKSIVASSQDGEGIAVTVTRTDSRKRAVDEVAEIKTPEGLENAQTLVVGPLDRSDVEAAYGSDVSVDFRKYIQDPNATLFMTERALRGRIVAIDGSGFFVNLVGHIPAPGPLTITVPYLSHQMTNTSRPMLLHWDTGAYSWMITSKTCKSHNGTQESFDADKLRLSTIVCRTHSNHESQPDKIRKRSTDGGSYFKKETHFIVGQVSTATQNSPPIVSTEPMLTVPEDSAILRHTLTARDPDGDNHVFAIDETKPSPNGVAVITPGGKMEYEPCMDCNGIDTVYYTVTEVNMGDVTPLVSRGSISINLTGLNDAPELFLSRNGIVIFTADSTFYEVNVSVEENTGYNIAYTDLTILVGAYDRDVDDVLNITSQAPANGELILANSIQTTPNLPVTCIDPEAYAFPCTGLNLPHNETKMSWITATVTYKPNLNFHGQDKFILKAVDESGYSSIELVVTVNILLNPCNHSGTCNGLQEDLNCTDHRRATVNFTAYYTCSCTGGWTGPFCDVDRDDCISIPCLYPFTCTDKLNGYECKCPDDWPDCDQYNNRKIGIIISGVAAFIGIVIVFIVIYRRRIRKHHVRKHNVRDAKLSGDRAQIELTASSLLDKHSKESANSNAASERERVQENYPIGLLNPAFATTSTSEVNGGDGVEETSFQAGDRTVSVTKIGKTDVSEEGTRPTSICRSSYAPHFRW